MDTGVDVPEVVNLVFFKIVRSKTKFWQMIGRGTRLCENLFGPDQDKDKFYIFDFCQSFEFFNENMDLSTGSSAKSLSERLFNMRVELSSELEKEIEADKPGGLHEEEMILEDLWLRAWKVVTA